MKTAKNLELPGFVDLRSHVADTTICEMTMRRWVVGTLSFEATVSSSSRVR